jgi:hypothetical protein
VERTEVRTAAGPSEERGAPVPMPAHGFKEARGDSVLVGTRKARPFEAARPEPVPPVEVHVTIGHIEVRTAPSSAPAPRRPAARPGLSLDAYLRRRDGGGR